MQGLKLKQQLTLIFQGTILLAIVLTSWLIYLQANRFFLGELRRSLSNQAAIVALNIDGEMHEKVKKADDPAYQAIHLQLARVMAVSPLVTDIYTIVPRYPDQNIWAFVVDGLPPTDPTYSTPWRKYDVRQDPQLPKALYGPTSSQHLYTDEYGTWLSGYAPIKRKDGRVVGVVGVDISGKTFLAQRAALLPPVILSLLVMLLFSFLITTPFLDRIIDPIEVERRIQQEQIAGLKQSEQVKDQFLSVLSHELRTPLNGISGFGSILQDELLGPLTPRQKEALERILESSDRMLELVDNLLDFGRMRAGKFTIEMDKTDYPSLVQEAVESMGAPARQKGIRVSTETRVPIPVCADRRRIIQVLFNLLSNAVKFTHEGGEIRVRSFIDGDRLVTEVQDNGIGLSPEDLSKLFVPFQQLDMSSTRKAKGTGLGLAISKEIVLMHGGTIEAESPGLGRGSTFRFSLPIKGSQAAENKLQA